jgi:uncharacterized membrane protein (DUF2068 family)
MFNLIFAIFSIAAVLHTIFLPFEILHDLLKNASQSDFNIFLVFVLGIIFLLLLYYLLFGFRKK